MTNTQNILLQIANGPSITIPKGTTLQDISKNHETSHPILVAKVNNKLQDLSKPLLEDSTIEFLDIRSSYGFKTYQRSVIFLMVAAAKEVLGKKTRILVEHSISKNIYCEIGEEENINLTPSLLLDIEEKMHQLANRQIPIEKISLTLEEAVILFNEFGLHDKIKNLNFRRTSNVSIYKMDWFYNYFYGELVPNTSYLKLFALQKQGQGFILQFEDPNNPENLREVTYLKKMTQVFLETSKWGKILNVDTVGSLNEKITKEGAGNIIKINEALHEKKIAAIADQIFEGKKNIIFIAGPTSSGKTTFAHRLGVQLKVHGLFPHVISLDNYYMDKDKIPKDAFGEPDLESIRALDVKCINEDLNNLANGKEVDIPKYDFIAGKKNYKGNFFKLEKSGVLVVEGIHGLNDAIGVGVEESNKFRIFISAITQLNIDDHNRIPTSDTRLIRRIVRDAAYRGLTADENLSMWPSVQRGESKYIFPYQEKADAIFNSALVYEISILKQYVEPLLFNIDKHHPVYVEARRLIKFLDSFLGVSGEGVPQNSILREFIGGSSINIHH